MNNYKKYPEVLSATPPGVQYLVFQAERGESGTPHIQGYVQFEKQGYHTRTHALLLDLFGSDGTVLAAKGSDQDNEDYCTKVETREHGPFRWGTRVPHAGKKGGRTDILKVKADLDAGVGNRDMWDRHFGIMRISHKAFREYVRVRTQPRNFKTVVILLVGPSGTGKSRTAETLCRLLGSHYKVPEKHGSGNLWCDDYGGEDVFSIDEMDGSRMTPTYFNQLADRYECIVPAHGGPGHQFVSKYMVVCSNYHPKYWWKRRNPDQVKQTMRRIDVIIKMIPPQPQYVHSGFQNFGNNINKSKK